MKLRYDSEIVLMPGPYVIFKSSILTSPVGTVWTGKWFLSRMSHVVSFEVNLFSERLGTNRAHVTCSITTPQTQLVERHQRWILKMCINAY